MADPQVPSPTSDPWEDAAKQYNAARNPGPPSLIKVGQRNSYAPKPVSDEEWKLWNAQSQDPEKPDFWGSLWGEIKNGPANLLGVGNAINANVSDAVHSSLAADPILGRITGSRRDEVRVPRAINQMGDAIAETWRKTKEAAQQGDYLGAARHAVNTGINAVAPGLGSSSDEAGDMYARGEYGPATGKTLGMGVNTVIGLKTPQIMEGAANLPGAVKGAFRADPRVAMTRALRPAPTDPNFPERVPETLRNIKAANEGEAPAGITNGKLDLVAATNKAIANHQEILDKWMARGKGVRVNGDELVQATREAIPELMWTRDPNGAQSLIADAQDAFGGKTFSVDQFRTFLKSENADLSPFYKRAPSVQANAAVAGTPPGIEAAQTERIRDVLYKALDPEGDGAGPRLIQQQTGDLIKMRNAAMNRNNAIVAEQPLTPVGRVVDPIKRVARQVIPGKATGAGIAYAEGSEGRSLPYIRRAFNAVGDEPPNTLPEPATPLYPTGDNARLLGPPDVFTPPPSDSSYVRSAPGGPPQYGEWRNANFRRGPHGWEDNAGNIFTDERLHDIYGEDVASRTVPKPPNTSRALPAGPNVRVTPPPADTSGVRVTTGEPLRAPTSRQLPRGPSVRTPSDLSGQAGDITDLVPVKNPITGKIEYIPRPQDTKDLPHYAKGGVIHKPTLLVDMASGKPSGVMAEKGPERIVPMHPPRLESPGREMKHEMNSEKAKLSPWRMGNLKPDQANFHMAKKPDAPIPNGESFNAFKRRTIGTLQKLLKHHAKNPEAKISVPSSGHATKLAEAWVKRGAPPSMEIDAKHMMGKGTPGSHRLFLAGGKPRIEPAGKSGKGGIYLTEDSGKLPTLKTPA